MICVTSVDTIKTPVVDVIGQLIRDVIGRLSVEPRCNWLERLNSDWCVSIRLQVVETSVNVISNSPSQDYTNPDDRTLLYDMTPGFKPFTTLNLRVYARSL